MCMIWPNIFCMIWSNIYMRPVFVPYVLKVKVSHHTVTFLWYIFVETLLSCYTGSFCLPWTNKLSGSDIGPDVFPVYIVGRGSKQEIYHEDKLTVAVMLALTTYLQKHCWSSKAEMWLEGDQTLAGNHKIGFGLYMYIVQCTMYTTSKPGQVSPKKSMPRSH